MNIWETTVLTDKGAALQSKLLNGQKLKIIRARTGGGNVPEVMLRQQISVTEGGQEIVLQEGRFDGEKFIIPVLLENKKLKESYDLWQVGFYAEDPDEGEILYCISQASKQKHIPAAAENPGYSITWDFYFQTSNIPQFEIVLNPKGSVNIESYQVQTDEIRQLNDSLGSLENLKTENHSNIIGAVNELSERADRLSFSLTSANQNLQNMNRDIGILQERTEDTWWIDMPLESGITSPGTAGDKLRYRRKNGIVFITGTFKVTGKAANTQRKICQPPIGFRSTYSGYYYLTNTATGHVVSRFIIGNDGSINLEWVKKISDGSELTGTINWVAIDFSYPV